MPPQELASIIAAKDGLQTKNTFFMFWNYVLFCIGLLNRILITCDVQEVTILLQGTLNCLF